LGRVQFESELSLGGITITKYVTMQKTCMLIDVAISEDRNMIKKETKKFLK
jgi:hypothetical protein